MAFLNEFVVGGVDFGIGQGALGVAIGKGIGHAFCSFGDALPAVDVEEFDFIQVGTW